MKKTCTSPSAVALPVSWKTQMDWANAVMLVASTEMIWPSQMRVKPAMPPGPRRPFVCVVMAFPWFQAKKRFEKLTQRRKAAEKMPLRVS